MAEAINLIMDVCREAVLTTLRGSPEMTLTQLEELLSSSEYGAVLDSITVADLWDDTPPQANGVRLGESLEDAVMRIFSWRPTTWLPSSVFVRLLGIRRWNAQATLATLCERDLLERTGNTSGTRYRLAPRSAAARRGRGTRRSRRRT